MGVTSGAGTAYPTPPVISGVRVARSLVFCIIINCGLSFCPFSVGHCVVCSATDLLTDYPFGIFKLFFSRISAGQWFSLGTQFSPFNKINRHHIIEFEIVVFNATFINISAISWRPVLVVKKDGVPGKNHRPWESNW